MVRGMRRHPTPRASTAEVVAVARLELVTDDEIALTAEVATVLARIVREHLNRTQPPPAPAAAGHTGAAH